MKKMDVRSAAIVALIGLSLVASVSGAPAQVPPGIPGRTQPGSIPATATPAPSALTPIPIISAPPTPTSTASGSPTAVPAGLSPQPATSGGATPGAKPSAAPLIRFGGQLLDLRNGYAFFTTGDAFKVAATVRITNLDTGALTTVTPAPPLYARATLDPSSGAITELALTKKKIATDAAYQAAYAQAHDFVVAGSPTSRAPELEHQARLTGRPVAVTFYVQVPPTTPFSDNVFISTDASGWVANAMKMDRIDALHYRITRTYASGTKFAYRYTRGSWTSVEVGEDGLEDDPHTFFVPEVDAKRLDNVVYKWSDQNTAQQQVGPDSIPTPFNPNPFGGLPTTVRPGIPQPSPTPRP